MKVRSAISTLVACALLATSCSSDSGSDSDPGSEDAKSASDDITSTEVTAPGQTDGDDATLGSSTPVTNPVVPDLEKPLWADLGLGLVPIAELLEPTAMSPRSGFEHLYVTERAGIVRLIERSFSKKGAERISLSSRPVLDISEMVATRGEGGLLGLAFSTDGRFMFLSYTDSSGALVVDEYSVGRGTRADAESRREILRVPQPASNHNGGQLALGPDGFLYIGIGDGGGSYDPDKNGQNTSTLLGSVIRIDTFVSGDEAYAIPAGNPFSDQGDGLAELFLWGVRNPWRFSFDQDNGDLWLPDIGQDTTEEVNYLPASSGGGRGSNLGWGDVEGHLPVEGGSPNEEFLAPIHVYDHEDKRCSVTGGFVYRGELVPELDGAYIFGDYCSGEIMGLHREGEVANSWTLPISTPSNQLVSFGQGLDGEIYVLQLDGQVSRIELVEPEEEG